MTTDRRPRRCRKYPCTSWRREKVVFDFYQSRTTITLLSFRTFEIVRRRFVETTESLFKRNEKKKSRVDIVTRRTTVEPINRYESYFFCFLSQRFRVGDVFQTIIVRVYRAPPVDARARFVRESIKIIIIMCFCFFFSPDFIISIISNFYYYYYYFISTRGLVSTTTGPFPFHTIRVHVKRTRPETEHKKKKLEIQKKKRYFIRIMDIFS